VSNGYQVNHEELADTASKTGDKAAEAEGIRAKVDAANGLVPSKAWGLLGNLTVYGRYQEVYATFSDHVNKMIAGVQKLSDDIKTTAERYKQNEDAVQEKFDEIGRELNGPSAKTAPAGKVE
jgi:uncharacterized protein YukE